MAPVIIAAEMYGASGILFPNAFLPLRNKLKTRVPVKQPSITIKAGRRPVTAVTTGNASKDLQSPPPITESADILLIAKQIAKKKIPQTRESAPCNKAVPRNSCRATPQMNRTSVIQSGINRADRSVRTITAQAAQITASTSASSKRVPNTTVAMAMTEPHAAHKVATIGMGKDSAVFNS